MRGAGIMASRSECLDIMDEVVLVLGISHYKLSFLLGTTPDVVSHWRSGDKRPSHAFFARIVKVQMEVMKGLDLSKVKTFLWPAGTPVYWPGWEPTEDGQ